MKKLLLLAILPIYMYAITSHEVFILAQKYTRYPSWIKAIIRVESSNGAQIVGDKGKSLGIAQIQVKTVRFMAKKYPKELGWTNSYNHKVIQTLLLRNDQFSIKVASIYLNYLIKRWGSVTKGVMAYNGLYVKRHLNWKYYRKVVKHLRD